MSRSFKHFPFVKDTDSCKWGKRYCNKKIRKTKDIPNGKAYRKFIEPWDYIYDFWCSETWEEYKERCEHPKWWGKPEEANHWDWWKYYKMK